MALDAKTLILGCSRDARKIAEELLEREGKVIVAAPGNKGDAGLFNGLETARAAGQLEIFTVTGSFACSGSAGRFKVTFTGNSKPIARTVSSIIIADEVERKPNFPLYGIAASKDVVSLSQFYELIESGLGSVKNILEAQRIAFLTGLVEESNPLITEEIMRCALKLQQEFKRQTYLLTGNLKVAGNGLEALYRHTKKAGAVYIKFSETTPAIQTAKSGKITISYVDEIIRETFKLNPDVTVIDEALQPSAFSRDLAIKLEIETGPDGFVQSDNVHRAPVFTNRKGVFVAGFSRGVQTADDRQAEAGSAALAVVNLYKETPEDHIGKAEINDTGHCIRCLTCARICPYGAISLNLKVAVDPQACEGCGICAAECPRFAIAINAGEDEAISDRIPAGKKTADNGEFFPSITAFCCSRSAKKAGDLAACMGYSLPAGLQMVEVPCAGSISLHYLYTAFSRGADGVLVLTCHEGNCHSEYGNMYAHQRVDQVSDRLLQFGLETGRLAYKTLASNMGTEFAETVNAFDKAIFELGPSRLKEAYIYNQL
jgi:coenzyme F420-reducing hydrogenase delta subunit/Pyruvate/2-oxoacid:ferredoxin oxidoreductase delta subunit